MAFHRFVWRLACCAALLLSLPALAQEWPTRPVKVIVPYPPGGGGDNSARPFAEKVSQILGQQFVIENRGGAGGAIGVELASKAPADGYTVMFTPISPLVVRPHATKVPYDLFRDFESVSLLAESVAVFAVHPSVGAKDLKELIAIAKQKPGEITYAVIGLGGITQLRVEYLKLLAGIDMTAVPYAGAGNVMTDLLAGHVKSLFEPSNLPQVKAGRLIGIGILDSERSPEVPDMPTMDEAAKAAGLPGYAMPSWQAVFVPKGTPRAIVDKLSAAVREAGRDKEMVDRMSKQSLRVITTTPEETTRMLRASYEQNGDLIRRANIKME